MEDENFGFMRPVNPSRALTTMGQKVASAAQQARPPAPVKPTPMWPRRAEPRRSGQPMRKSHPGKRGGSYKASGSQIGRPIYGGPQGSVPKPAMNTAQPLYAMRGMGVNPMPEPVPVVAYGAFPRISPVLPVVPAMGGPRVVQSYGDDEATGETLLGASVMTDADAAVMAALHQVKSKLAAGYRLSDEERGLINHLAEASMVK